MILVYKVLSDENAFRSNSARVECQKLRIRRPLTHWRQKSGLFILTDSNQS